MPARIHLITGRDLNVEDEAEAIMEALATTGRAAVRVTPTSDLTYVFLAGVAYVAPAPSG
jgi:hypothetical protein